MDAAWTMSKRLMPLLVVLVLAGTAGCAFTDRRVNLAPPTSVPVIRPSSPNTTGAAKAINIARPQDLRPDPTTVGNIKNGYGMVTAQVRSNNDIPLWVTNSIIQGLERSGYTIERVETVDNAHHPVVIDLAVSRVFTEHVPGFFTVTGSGDIVAQIEVYKNSKRVHRRTYTGTYKDTGLVVSTSADAYQQLLDAAMKNFLQKTLPDLVRVLERATGSDGETSP